MKIQSIPELYDRLPEHELLMVEVLRQIIKEQLPAYCKEKISFNVPFFYGKKGICIIWPAAIPRGGVASGVLLGFWQGHKLRDANQYLTHGTNKKIFYKIYQSADTIDAQSIQDLLHEAIELDKKS
jgi:hypothetical protein